MPSTYSPSLRIELIGTGEQSGTWGNTTNTNLGTLIEQAITGVLTINLTAGSITLTSINGATDQARNAVIVVTGTQVTTNNVVIPNSNKTYLINNTSSFQIGVKTSSGSAYFCPTGTISTVYCDGANNVAGASVLTTAPPAVQYVPSGAVFWFTMPTAPTGYLYADGAAVSRSVYADLFAVISTNYGVGDGSTTFNLPDLRGEFIRGWNSQTVGGSRPDSGRSFASEQTDLIENHTHPASTTASDSGHAHGYGTFGAPAGSGVAGGADYVFSSSTTNTGFASISASTTISNNTGGGSETRPVNIALLPCIKT